MADLVMGPLEDQMSRNNKGSACFRKRKKTISDPSGDDEIETLNGHPRFLNSGSALPKTLPEGAARVGEAGSGRVRRGPRPKSKGANFKMDPDRSQKSADRPDQGLYGNLHFMKNAMALSDGLSGLFYLL